MLKKRPNSDGAIIREVLKGDRERFDGLVERHLPAVYATALAHTRNSTDAEDVVQDTFLSAFTALDTLRAPGRFGPWVITIARNTALKHLRRKKATGGKDAREPTNTESPISAAQRKEFGVFLSEAIAGLPEGDREAILLHYFSGKSAREVAQALGVSRAAVLKRLERGRARLGKSLLERLGDEETVRDALRPSIHRVTRGIAAAAVTWEASKSLTTGSALAASLSVLPKAGTVAACLAGMGFMAVVGWNYLKSDAVEQVEAVPEPPAASRAKAELAVVDDAPEPSTLPAAPLEQETELVVAMQTETVSEPEAEPAPSVSTTTATADSTEALTTIDGFWDLNMGEQGGGEMPHFGRIEMSSAGGELRMLSAEGPVSELIQSMIQTGQHLEVTFVAPLETCTLSGDFNEALTEFVLEGVFYVEVEGLEVEMPMRMVGTRVTAEELSRDEQIQAFKVRLLHLSDKLQAYAAEHGGDFPEKLTELYPRYVSDRSTLESNATRSLVYRKPPSFQFEQDIGEASDSARTETDPNELMEIEYYLQDMWGESFLIKVPVLESIHRELEVHLQISDKGKVTEVTQTEKTKTHGTVSEGQARAQNASCMNNLKQIGLMCKLFEHEQAAKLLPPGFRALHPNFITDTRILTCPGAEPGTESYELLFPATTAAYMVQLAGQIEGLSEETYSEFLRSRIPIALEQHECSGLEGRNVLFLDGHVELLKDGTWESTIEAYLQR